MPVSRKKIYNLLFIIIFILFNLHQYNAIYYIIGVVKNNDVRLQIPKVIRDYFDVFGSLKLHKNSTIKIAYRLILH